MAIICCFSLGCIYFALVCCLLAPFFQALNDVHLQASDGEFCQYLWNMERSQARGGGLATVSRSSEIVQIFTIVGSNVEKIIARSLNELTRLLPSFNVQLPYVFSMG